MPELHVLNGEKWVPMTPAPFTAEALLQDYLAAHPDLMPGELLNENDPRRWLLIGKEVGIAFMGETASTGSIDHLFVDQDGVPTLVEVKRAADLRNRREVVAQMLDYAASMWAWKPGSVSAVFEARCTKENIDAALELENLLGADDDHDAFWRQVDANLRAGRMRLLFFSERISGELKQIIEFLNSQLSQAEVVAVEVTQWTGGGITTLRSQVFGNTASAKAAKDKSAGGAKRKTTREEFLGVVGPPAAGFFTELLTAATDQKFVVYWGEVGFSIRVSRPDGKLATLLYAYPPTASRPKPVFQVYLRDLLDIEDPGGLRAAVMAIDGFKQNPGAQHTVTIELEPGNLDRARDAMALAWKAAEAVRKNASA